MHLFRLILCGLLFATASTHRGMCAPPPNTDAKAEQPAAKLEEIVIPVRIHLMQSASITAMHTTLTEPDVQRIFGKVNRIWSQAGIRFEIESIVHTEAVDASPEIAKEQEHARVKSMIPKAGLSPAAIDVCYVKQVTPNGFYYGEPIVVKDTAKLRPVEGGLDEPLPRVTSHEIGHALSLSHRQDTTNLMASGTTGFSLNDAEIQAAREKAKAFLKAIPASNPQPGTSK